MKWQLKVKQNRKLVPSCRWQQSIESREAIAGSRGPSRAGRVGCQLIESDWALVIDDGSLRKPAAGPFEAAYASHDYQKLLKQHGMAVYKGTAGKTEAILGSVKREWTGDPEAITGGWIKLETAAFTLGYSTPLKKARPLASSEAGNQRSDHMTSVAGSCLISRNSSPIRPSVQAMAQ